MVRLAILMNNLFLGLKIKGVRHDICAIFFAIVSRELALWPVFLSFVIPGQSQYIIQRCNNRQVIFAAEADFQFLRDAVVEATTECGLAIHAYSNR